MPKSPKPESRSKSLFQASSVERGKGIPFIDAPASAQQCSTKDEHSWPCDRRSAAALDGYVLDKTVRCQPKDTDRYRRVVAECFVQGRSVNRWMVHSGWAVAYRQYATAFIADEVDARQHQRHLWQGPFQMPADYRRSKRDQAAREAQVDEPTMPGGCRIKGNISRQGKKIYHALGQQDYARTSIDQARGERMFCGPEEAMRAGWLPAKRLHTFVCPSGGRSPSSHSHEAALRDRFKTQTSVGSKKHPAQVRERVTERVQQIKERLARQPAPHPRLHTPYSGPTRHLSKVTRLARSSGRPDSEVLNAEAQLIEDWLEAQRKVVQQSLEVLRQIPGIQIESEFQRAHSVLVCRRVDSYATKSFLFEDTEVLARSISKYAHTLVRPYKARMAVLDAKAKLNEQEDDPDPKVVARARQRLARAKRHVSPRVQAIQKWRIKKARKTMVEAAEALNKKFALQPIGVPMPETTVEEAPPPQAEGEAGHWELRFRPPKPSF